MPFTYGTYGAVKNIAEDGSDMLAASLSPKALPGALLQATFTINAVGTDSAGDPQTVYNLMFAFRFCLFTQPGTSINASPGQGFRLQTGSAVAAAADMQFQSSSSQNAPNTNYSATLEVVSSTQVKIVFRFYCTSEDPNYAPFFVQNLNRFLASKNIGGQHMELTPGSQYSAGTSGVSIQTLVSGFPPTTPMPPPWQFVTFGGAQERYINVFLRWFGRNSTDTVFSWIVSEFSNTTASDQVIALKTHKSTVLPHQAKYDDNFVVTSSSMSSIEDNYFYFKFNNASGATTSMTSVRAMLLRVDGISNSQQFLADYEASIALVPASDTTYDQISGAIHAPASFVNSGSNQCEVSFRVPASFITTGAKYRVLVLLYSTGTADMYGGVSHELTADDHPNFYPQADIFTADYFQESPLPRGMMGYHSAYRSRISILKSSVDEAFSYYSLTGNFDDNVNYVKASVLKPGTESASILTPDVGAEKFMWMRGVGLTQGIDLVNDATTFGGAFLDYISEQWAYKYGSLDALWYISIQWEIGIDSQLPTGESVFLKCRYNQKIDARRWESEAGQPSTPPFNLDMTLYRMDGTTIIPTGTQYVCGNDEMLALVEKSEDLSDGTMDAYLIPETYGETATDGTTTDINIKQRRGAFMGYIPASANPEINAFDSLFSLNAVLGSTVDDAGVRIDIRDLGNAQKFWLGAIARKVWPNAVPFISDDVDVDLVRASDVTTITANFTSWWVSLVADTGAVSPFNFRIVNHVTQNFAGITGGAFNNPSSDDTQIEVTVDHLAYPTLLNIDIIYEIEGTIVVSGSNHLVRFMVRKTFALPTADGALSGTIETADWQAVDFDY